MSAEWGHFLTVPVPPSFSDEQRAIAEHNNRVAKKNNTLLLAVKEASLRHEERAAELSCKAEELAAAQQQINALRVQAEDTAKTAFRSTIAAAEHGARDIYAIAEKHRTDSQAADREIASYVKQQTIAVRNALHEERDKLRIKSAEYDSLLIEARVAVEAHANRADNLKIRIYALRDTLKAALEKQAALQNKIELITASVFS